MSRKVLRAIGVLAMVSATVISTGGRAAEPTPLTPYDPQREDIAGYIDQLVAQHGFARAGLEAVLGRAHHRQDIIARISRPAEKVWTWTRYRHHLVDDKRIQGGVAFWRAHADTLARAAETYGVAPEYVVAILGIETRYGQVTGSFPVLDALATLGFDYPPRADFFRRELTEFLLLAREEGKDPASLMGSYAGAMGYGQFISSSYRHYAVDFNGDGQRDIWHDPVDAIGSVANYFARHGWRGNELLAVPVQVTVPATAALANGGLKPTRSVAQWQQMGVGLAPTDTPVAADAAAALLRFDTDEGQPQFWLGLHDFYVITRYNHSHMYALAVHQLSQAIRQRYEALRYEAFIDEE